MSREGREAGEGKESFSPSRSSRDTPGFQICVYLCPSVVYFPRMKLISWNVNGLRAVLKKNFLEFLDAEKPDVLCLQEIKCTSDQVEQLWPAHYTTYWNSAEKKGYSGTAIFTKRRPLKISPHVNISEHDKEGR